MGSARRGVRAWKESAMAYVSILNLPPAGSLVSPGNGAVLKAWNRPVLLACRALSIGSWISPNEGKSKHRFNSCYPDQTVHRFVKFMGGYEKKRPKIHRTGHH